MKMEDTTAEHTDQETPEKRLTYFELLDAIAFPPLLRSRVPSPTVTVVEPEGHPDVSTSSGGWVN